MDAQQIKGKEKVHFGDSESEDSVQTYKRSRQPVPEIMRGDVPQQQNHHAFWKIRDQEGWKHGIMVDENRQHWKCTYCSVVGHSGGISGLKRHLVGDTRAKKCTAVPEDVSAQIKQLMDDRKEKRQKRAAQKGAHKEEATNHTNAQLQKTAHEKNCSSILRESAPGAPGSTVWAHVPGGECYCYFCTLERANEGTKYEEMALQLLQRKMVQVVDMILSAAEQLNTEEQSLTMIK